MGDVEAWSTRLCIGGEAANARGREEEVEGEEGLEMMAPLIPPLSRQPTISTFRYTPHSTIQHHLAQHLLPYVN